MKICQHVTSTDAKCTMFVWLHILLALEPWFPIIFVSHLDFDRGCNHPLSRSFKSLHEGWKNLLIRTSRSSKQSWKSRHASFNHAGCHSYLKREIGEMCFKMLRDQSLHYMYVDWEQIGLALSLSAVVVDDDDVLFVWNIISVVVPSRSTVFF